MRNQQYLTGVNARQFVHQCAQLFRVSPTERMKGNADIAEAEIQLRMEERGENILAVERGPGT
jgi:hypothetical protein